MIAKELIHQYLMGNLDRKRVDELDLILREDPALRREFALAASVDSALRERAINDAIERSHGNVPPVSAGPPKFTVGGWVLAVTAALSALLLLVLGMWPRQPATIASLIQSENAAWESELPTSVGSDLSPGVLRLRTGIAAIRFTSGAEMVMESPASVELITPMRARLVSGAAVLEVPESAKGFTLDTPEGYAVDFGTRFAVQVDQDQKVSGFELIEGEIELHHKRSRASVRLREQGARAQLSADSVQRVDAAESEFVHTDVETDPSLIRISSNGRCGTSMTRSHKRHKFINPEVLIVKRSKSGRWDYRSFVEFDLGEIDLQNIESARIRLNLVPSDRGVASRLPKINRFAIYGLTTSQPMDWDGDFAWDDVPGPDDGKLLGKFEIPRSESRGTYGIATEELLNFIKQRKGPVAFVVVRETTSTEGLGIGMPHMFASDQHPESVGPLMEIRLNDPS